MKSAGVDLNTAEKADEIPGGKQAGNRRETGGRQAKFGVERLDVSVSCFAHTHTRMSMSSFSVKVGCKYR